MVNLSYLKHSKREPRKLRLLMEYILLESLLLILACKVQGAALNMSLFGIKPQYEFICLVFAISSKTEDQKFLVINVSAHLDSNYSILQSHVMFFKLWKHLKIC